MSPSTESQSLANLYQQISQAFPADGNVQESRFIYENLQQVAKEAPGVTFEEDVVADRPCLWL